MPLQREERVEYRPRIRGEELLVADVEQLVDAPELIVDGDRRDGGGVKLPVQVLQEQRIDLSHDLGGAVVALHQLLAGALRRRVGEIELARERRLQVEHEPILATSGKI